MAFLKTPSLFASVLLIVAGTTEGTLNHNDFFKMKSADKIASKQIYREEEGLSQIGCILECQQDPERCVATAYRK